MKRTLCLLVSLTLLLPVFVQAQVPTPATSSAKNAKPQLFSALPASFEVNASELQKIFSAQTGQVITLSLAPQLFIDGKVVDKSQHTPGSVTVNIRVSNYSNALLNATLRLNADNSSSIHGRILHPRYSDVLEVYKDEDKYFIKKNSQALVMPE